MSRTYGIGMKIGLPAKTVTQEHINQYAKASNDMNPLHIDLEFAKKTIFKGTIAHGLMSMAFLNELMTRNFGNAWNSSGELSITFLAPVKPEDIITAMGEISGKDDETGKLEVKVECRNQNDKAVIAGKAYVSSNI